MLCSKCGEDKLLAAFYKNDRTCKVCRCAKVRQHRLDNLAKTMVFGERYGLINFNQECIKLSGKQPQFANLDFSNLERRASVFWIDDV